MTINYGHNLHESETRTRPMHGPGRLQAGPGCKLSARPARVIEISRTHSALVHSFQCINMKLMLKRVIRCFHTDDVFTSHC